MTKDDDLFKKPLMIVKDPDLLRDLQEAAYRKNGSGHGAASRMKEDLHAQKWQVPLLKWEREDLLAFFLGRDLAEYLTGESQSGKDAVDGGSTANELHKAGKRRELKRCWRYALLVAKPMIERQLTFSDLFKEAEQEAPSVSTSSQYSVKDEYAGFSGWYVSFRRFKKERQFGVLKITGPDENFMFEIEGFTYQNDIEKARLPEVIWFGKQFVINPHSLVGFYDYSGTVDGETIKGMAVVRFLERKDGKAQMAMGTTLDKRKPDVEELNVYDQNNDQSVFEMQLERVNFDAIDLPPGRESPLDLERMNVEDQKIVIRHYRLQYLGREG